MIFNEEEILSQLDTEAETYEFPMLDNGYYYHCDQKLTIYRDETRWAMTIEVLAYNNHEDSVFGITTLANTFGNCILTAKLNDNDNFFLFVKDKDLPTFLYDEEVYVPYLNPDAKSILIKEQEIQTQFDPSHYKSKGINFEYENRITPWEFIRGFVPEKSTLFWVTRQEISHKIPIDLPLFMTLDNWHHPDLANCEKPSDTETFRQLAKVIATGDKNYYKTNEPHNTHWTNWPDGGTL